MLFKIKKVQQKSVLTLANSLSTLEQQVNETFNLAKKQSESQFKGKLT